MIVGSGIAGLVAALEASRVHDVTLVTKASIGESNTRYAQGGIAASLGADDSVASHVSDTVRAGSGLVDERMARILCSEGPARVLDLARLGVRFDRAVPAGGSAGAMQLALGMEAAHSHARVVHAGGDATGVAVESVLAALTASSRVTILEHTFLADIVLSGDRAVGVEVIDSRPGNALTSRVIAADRVVIATGGAGQLYPHTTNPIGATGDGVAAAIRAGAAVSDVEFYQFHPTALAVPGNFLVSEAVRGEGAVLLDASGRRFMTALHPDAELAPRDIVAREIARVMAAQGGAPVLLDATARGERFLRQRFPSITAACADHGFDFAREPVPVTPAAHYWMGGIRTDDRGRSSIAGLFAIGEAATTGVHGANRLASNSLLEGLVFAARCAAVLGEEWPRDVGAGGLPGFVSDGASFDGNVGSGAHGPLDRAALQALMWAHVGLERDEAGLHEAAESIRSLDQRAGMPDDLAIADRETANLGEIARVIVAAARVRRESRGAHYRTDFPVEAPGDAVASSWVRDLAQRKVAVSW